MEMEAAAAVADRFPDAKNIASFDKPMNVADSKLATQIEAEYRAILQQSADARVRQLLSEFEAAKKPEYASGIGHPRREIREPRLAPLLVRAARAAD